MSVHRDLRPRGSGTGHENAAPAFSGLNILAGAWLILTPFVLGFDYSAQFWNTLIVGAATIVFAAVRLVRPQSIWPSWVNAALGVWLAVLPWVYTFDYGPVLIHNVVLGIIIAALSIASIVTARGTGVATDGDYAA